MIDVDRTLQLAKRGQFSRSQLYAHMQSIAEQQRQPGESTAQSFARFFCGTDEGRELFQIHKSMPGRDIEPAAVVVKSGTGTGDQWDDLIRTLRKAHGCSEARAINEALSTAAGKFAFARKKRADQIASGEFSQADLEVLDAIAKEQNDWLAVRKGAPSVGDAHSPAALKAREYEDELDKVRMLYPKLTESQIHDEARKREPEAWEQYKLGKLGGGALPQSRHQREQAGDEGPEEARSGRKQPSRAPLWESEHSSSPTTPEHKPAKLSDTPAIKAWCGLINHVQKKFGLEREHTVELLLKTPVAKQVFDRALSEL